MAVVKSKPTSPGRRHQVRVVHKGLAKAPYKPLTAPMSSTGGRNSEGRITTRHRGGGHKRRYRVIDFRRNKDGIPASVEQIEYDPNRSALIALLRYADGERRYVIAVQGLKVGDMVVNGDDAPIKAGNCLPMMNIPFGTVISCVELKPGKGAQLMRSAGASAQMVSREGAYAIIRMRSGEMRRILAAGRAVIGAVSNSEHNLRQLGKAGAGRWRGRRPTVRGVAMNPVDHPHGGGEGKTSGGRHPVSPTGVLAKGYRTRRNKRTSDLIIRDRRGRNK